MSVKEQVLPDDIDFRDVTDEIALLAAVHEAEQDIQQGRVISNDEMKSRIAQWSGWEIIYAVPGGTLSSAGSGQQPLGRPTWKPLYEAHEGG